MSGGPGFNPLALLLLAASLAPLAIVWLRGRGRRRSSNERAWGWSGAWAALGLAGGALLLPALAISDGVPSPAAILGDVAPWADRLDSGAGNQATGDVTHQIQPWLLFLRAELRAGRLPWWNPFQYSGTPFWSNGQGAPLFPLHLLFAALPLPLGWLLLPWLRVLIGGLGVRALALRLGLEPRAALVGALIYPLSGMLTCFLLYPMGNALALVPWVLWAVERLAQAPRRCWHSGVAALASMAGLQLLAGHPETAVHTGLLSTVYLLVRGVAGADWRGSALIWGRFIAGWTLAASVAAVQIVPLVATLRASSRWQREVGEFAEPLTRLLAQPLRLLLPDLYGHPVDGSWWGPYNYLATAVYVGAFALPLAAAGLMRVRGGRGKPVDRRWLGVVAILGVSFAGAYHLPPVRQLLEVLPVVGRALHHRLIFGLELALALLAAAGVGVLLGRRGENGRRLRGLGVPLAGASAACVLLAVAWWRYAGRWMEHGLVGRQVVATASILGASALVLALWRLRERGALRWAVLALTVVIPVELVAVHARFNPGLSHADLYPATPAIELLQQRLATAGEGRVAAPGRNLTPNAASVYRLLDVRGDDTVKLAHYERFAAEAFGSGHPTFFRPIREWDESWLDRLSVGWVLGAPRRPPPVAGWRLIYDGVDARVWERPGRAPMVRWSGREGGDWKIEVVQRSPGRWRLQWAAPAPGVLVVAETFDAGWRARTRAGSKVKPQRADDALLGLALGPGEGELELWYRPVGIGLGTALSAAALAVVGLLAWASRRRRSAGESP